MEDMILIFLLALIVGLAAFYVIRARKSGKKCIGCPDGASCPYAKKGGCACGDKKA